MNKGGQSVGRNQDFAKPEAKVPPDSVKMAWLK